jgi:hypothetical protein
MNNNVNKICKDPLFQINLVIWLAQPLPENNNLNIYPIFYKSDLNIYSIGPKLALPPDIILTIQGKIEFQNGARPDILLEAKKIKKLCFIECKSSSFGKNSSTAKQARTILIISGPIISEVLALSTIEKVKGITCFLTPSNQTELLKNTLQEIEYEINIYNLEIGDYDCFGLKTNESTISLEYSAKIKRLLNLIKEPPVRIVSFEKNCDPRPLYFIPYDPNINQSKEEQELCRRILLERILSHVISKIGSAIIPSSISFKTEEILNSITFGIYEIWEDNEAKKYIRGIVKQEFFGEILKTIQASLRELIAYESGIGWKFELKDRNIQEDIIKQFIKFKPEVLDLSKEIQPTLFDDDLD